MGVNVFGLYVGSLYNLPCYSTMLAQAERSVEAQRQYVLGMQAAKPQDFLSQLLLLQHYRPPNPVPWEQRYADFCKRLAEKTGMAR